MVNPQLHTPIERSIIPENFMTLSFTVSEKMEKQFWISLLRISKPEVTFEKEWKDTLHISGVNNIY
jgi:hypothetical protein